MNLSRLSAERDLMVAEPGIVGCALVAYLAWDTFREWR